MAVRSTLEVLEHQLWSHICMVLSLSNPSKDMLVRSQATPVHNIQSEETLGLVNYYVQHAPNVNI